MKYKVFFIIFKGLSLKQIKLFFLRLGSDFKFSLGSPCLKRHYVKITQIRSFSGPFSVRLRGNMDQKNSVFEQFSRSKNDLKTFKTT